jgi:hypothetical protein
MEGGPSVPPTNDEVVQALIVVRDKRTALSRAFEDEDRKLVEMKDKLETFLLTFLTTNKLQNAKTAFGTFGLRRKTTASVSDGEAFRAFVFNGHQDLIETRANPKAVEDWMKTNKAPVPGVSLSTRIGVGVTRAGKPDTDGE